MGTYKLSRREALLLVELLAQDIDRQSTTRVYLKHVDKNGSLRRKSRRKEKRMILLRKRLWEETVLKRN